MRERSGEQILKNYDKKEKRKKKEKRTQCLVPLPCTPNRDEPAKCFPHCLQTAGSPFFSKACSFEQNPQTIRVATEATSGGCFESEAAESSWQTSHGKTRKQQGKRMARCECG